MYSEIDKAGLTVRVWRERLEKTEIEVSGRLSRQQRRPKETLDAYIVRVQTSQVEAISELQMVREKLRESEEALSALRGGLYGEIV